MSCPKLGVGNAIISLLLTCSPICLGQVIGDEGWIAEELPSDVVASMEVRDRMFAMSGNQAIGEAYVSGDLNRWEPETTITVAFLGGTSALHAQIETALKQISDACSIQFDLGKDPKTGSYRSWTRNDKQLVADIRVSFDQKGYFSLVGTDCKSPSIGPSNGQVGGRPYQCSLNLGRFDVQLPKRWKQICRHEFMHALAFHHEHQSPAGGCDSEFRWDDDKDYAFEQDAEGMYIVDQHGRRPGIYTYMSGHPNNWDKAKVDRNMKSLGSAGLTVSGFDRASIMLYRFPEFFYKSQPSPCAPSTYADDLSTTDCEGLLKLYPRAPAAIEEITATRRALMEAAMKDDELEPLIRESIKATFGDRKDK